MKGEKRKEKKRGAGKKNLEETEGGREKRKGRKERRRWKGGFQSCC